MGAWDKEPLAEARRPLEGGRLHPCQVTAGQAGRVWLPARLLPLAPDSVSHASHVGPAACHWGLLLTSCRPRYQILALTLSKYRLRLKKLAGRVKGVEALCDPAGSHPEGRFLMVGRSWSFLRPLSPELSVQRIVGPEGHWERGPRGRSGKEQVQTATWLSHPWAWLRSLGAELPSATLGAERAPFRSR